MFKEFKDILSISDLCKALDIGKNSAYKLVKNGCIKSVRIGCVYKIPKQALIEYINKI